MTSTKRCAGCGVVKDSGEFSPDRSKASGFKSICRGCDRVKARAYYAAHREARAAYYQRRRRAVR